MPPKKRARTDAAASPSKPAASGEHVERPAQNSPFLTIPVELWRAITTHLGAPIAAPYEGPQDDNQPPLPVEYHERTDNLRALSQTCHQLRVVFLPLLWESFNVCVKSRKAGAFYKILGDFLKNASERLAKLPELLSYVRTVNVVLTRYSSTEVLPPFARCLTLMPNLHTLQIIHAHTKMTTHLKNGFEGTAIPTVRRLILPASAHEVLRCCPEVTYVNCNDGGGDKLISAFAKCCKKVEVFDGFSVYYDKELKRLIKAAPNLKTLEFCILPTKETIDSLRPFKKLSALTIQVEHQTRPAMIDSVPLSTLVTEPNFQPSVEAAKAFLLEQKVDTPLRLTVKHAIPTVDSQPTALFPRRDFVTEQIPVV